MCDRTQLHASKQIQQETRPSIRTDEARHPNRPVEGRPATDESATGGQHQDHRVSAQEPTTTVATQTAATTHSHCHQPRQEQQQLLPPHEEVLPTVQQEEHIHTAAAVVVAAVDPIVIFHLFQLQP